MGQGWYIKCCKYFRYLTMICEYFKDNWQQESNTFGHCPNRKMTSLKVRDSGRRGGIPRLRSFKCNLVCTGKMFFFIMEAGNIGIKQWHHCSPRRIMWLCSTPNFRSTLDLQEIPFSLTILERKESIVKQHQWFSDQQRIKRAKTCDGTCSDMLGRDCYIHEAGSFCRVLNSCCDLELHHCVQASLDPQQSQSGRNCSRWLRKCLKLYWMGLPAWKLW